MFLLCFNSFIKGCICLLCVCVRACKRACACLCTCTLQHACRGTRTMLGSLFSLPTFKFPKAETLLLYLLIYCILQATCLGICRLILLSPPFHLTVGMQVLLIHSSQNKSKMICLCFLLCLDSEFSLLSYWNSCMYLKIVQLF